MGKFNSPLHPSCISPGLFFKFFLIIAHMVVWELGGFWVEGLNSVFGLGFSQLMGLGHVVWGFLGSLGLGSLHKHSNIGKNLCSLLKSIFTLYQQYSELSSFSTWVQNSLTWTKKIINQWEATMQDKTKLYFTRCRYIWYVIIYHMDDYSLFERLSLWKSQM